MALRDELLARADALMQNAPGRVSVRRVSHIDEVKVLRAARAALTTDEDRQLREMRLELMERLDGSVSAAPVAAAEEKKGWFGALLARAARGFANEMRPQADFADLATQTGTITRLPAPVELLDAAEAWMLAHLVADRVDGDLSVLRQGWDEASIEPIG